MLDSVTSCLCSKDIQIHVTVSITVKVLAEFLQCNDREMDEAIDFKCFFVI